MKKVVIVGGGISGLALAHRLTELGQEKNASLDITLLEAANRFGGVIETFFQDGFLMEAGPDSFISEKPAALDLCRRLGLEGEVIGTQNEFRRSFILGNNKLIPVPEGFYLVSPTSIRSLIRTPYLSWMGKLRMALELFIPPRSSEQDESVGSFVRRRFGREALEKIGQPMIGGIYSADPDRLSLEATMPRFREIEKEYGSLIRGFGAREKRRAEREASGPRYSLFLSLQGGMSRLVETLIERMSAVHFHSATAVSRIEREGKGGWKIFTQSGQIFEADILCLATGAPRSAALLRPVAEDLSSLLFQIPYESVATLNLGYRRGQIQHELNGFGFVVPATEEKSFVGCTFSSVKYPGRSKADQVLLRAFIGGAFHRDTYALDDRSIIRSVKGELEEILSIQGEPASLHFERYHDAMPQYQVGHRKRIEQIAEKVQGIQGLYLTGNAYEGIGIPDCIRHAEDAAARIIESLKNQTGSDPTGVEVVGKKAMNFDHVLVIGFGGPRKPEEVMPFLDDVTRGLPIPPARLAEVARHYDAIGGASPYNEYALRLVSKMKEALAQKGFSLPIFVGMKHGHPFLKDVLMEIDQRGLRKGIGLILAAQRSDASFDKYVRGVDEAKRSAGAFKVNYEYLKPSFDHPGFIRAQAEQVRKILKGLPPAQLEKTHLLFSAHSIPLKMAEQCRYAEEFKSGGELVAQELSFPRFDFAYQSRSGNPREPWLEPDVTTQLTGLAEKGAKTVIFIPIGFLSDNAEVLYDLDIEAKAFAERLGLCYRRASTVMDHPVFAAMLAELIQEHLEARPVKRGLSITSQGILISFVVLSTSI